MKTNWIQLIWSAIKSGILIGFQSIAWATLRPLITKAILAVAMKAIGPVGWIAKLVPMIVEKGIKPWFQMAMRKIKKKQRAEQGKKEAQETRDVPADNVDDVYDSMQ